MLQIDFFNISNLHSALDAFTLSFLFSGPNPIQPMDGPNPCPTLGHVEYTFRVSTANIIVDTDVVLKYFLE